ncbi:MAG: hydantoinase B/oxoprolinase family protein [Gammaproteobacteria bacterium]|nr:hydantoinase B/oxoprolinase family protein [Gammaproteobacteria bacterium]
MNPIELNIFASRLNAVCDEMGAVLQRTAFSPNIKDRLDFSCAVFDNKGELCAQAAHIPVHLGSMAYAMRDIVSQYDWQTGDMLILNDPYLGGTHLPDVTLIAPVFVDAQLVGFVANRAHHADIGSDTPGSMPITHLLEEEGMIIPPSFLIKRGKVDDALKDKIINSMRNQHIGEGDFTAQISANQSGKARLELLVGSMGNDGYVSGLVALNEYAERLARSALAIIPDGYYEFSDVMDDDGLGCRDIKITCSIKVTDGNVHVDFSGTADQTSGNINCPLSVAAAGVYYAFRCLMPAHTPACAGSFRPISLQAPKGCLVNARYPAAVAAGNVETSTRIVDVVLGALAQAIPEKIPAASHGSMNNLAMGSDDPAQPWDYYETIGGGMGASKYSNGLNAVQTHMTNTLNTPIESLEMHYPLRIKRYAIRDSSGGKGKNKGGDGLIREFEFLASTNVTLLTERRTHSPWGLQEGDSGKPGMNRHDNKVLPGKINFKVEKGESLTIETPGGGGWGKTD